MTREPPDAGRVGRWRTMLSSEDQHTFEEVAGDLLAELGYDVAGNGEVSADKVGTAASS